MELVVEVIGDEGILARIDNGLEGCACIAPLVGAGKGAFIDVGLAQQTLCSLFGHVDHLVVHAALFKHGTRIDGFGEVLLDLSVDLGRRGNGLGVFAVGDLFHDEGNTAEVAGELQVAEGTDGLGLGDDALLGWSRTLYVAYKQIGTIDGGVIDLEEVGDLGIAGRVAEFVDFFPAAVIATGTTACIAVIGDGEAEVLFAGVPVVVVTGL